MPPDNAERRPNGNEGAAPESTATTTDTSLQPAAEVVATSTLTEAEATRLTTRIQLRLDTIADNTELVIPMIEAAKNGNAHQALGYQSWTAYVSDKFGGTLARLTKVERLPVVELLADQGMSTRAIAGVVGVSKSTVADDLSRSGHLTTEPVADYLAMADATEDDFEAALSEARSQDDLSRESVVPTITRGTISEAPVKNITGIDGKSYSRHQAEPGAAKPRRRPLPDAYRDHAGKVLKSVESLSRLHQDDRFTSNREAVSRHAHFWLVQAVNELVDLLDDLGIDRHKYGGDR